MFDCLELVNSPPPTHPMDMCSFVSSCVCWENRKNTCVCSAKLSSVTSCQNSPGFLLTCCVTSCVSPFLCLFYINQNVIRNAHASGTVSVWRSDVIEIVTAPFRVLPLSRLGEPVAASVITTITRFNSSAKGFVSWKDTDQQLSWGKGVKV